MHDGWDLYAFITEEMWSPMAQVLTIWEPEERLEGDDILPATLVPASPVNGEQVFLEETSQPLLLTIIVRNPERWTHPCFSCPYRLMSHD